MKKLTRIPRKEDKDAIPDRSDSAGSPINSPGTVSDGSDVLRGVISTGRAWERPSPHFVGWQGRGI